MLRRARNTVGNLLLVGIACGAVAIALLYAPYNEPARSIMAAVFCVASAVLGIVAFRKAKFTSEDCALKAAFPAELEHFCRSVALYTAIDLAVIAFALVLWSKAHIVLFLWSLTVIAFIFSTAVFFISRRLFFKVLEK